MIIKAPIDFSAHLDKCKVFLAGSIEMNRTVDWQKQVEGSIDSDQVLILNPRRDDWDSSWKQEKTNVQFKAQVQWELLAQKKADLIIMNFVPDTLSPITLMELGLFKDKNMIVCCPNGYWRKGNVDIVCEEYGIKQVPDIGTLVDEAKIFIDLFAKR
jgi:hypothetical protein